MNGSLAANQALLAELLQGLGQPGCDVAVAVPAVYVGQVQSLLQLACWGSAHRVWLQAHSATLLLASVMRDAKCTRHVERSLVS